LAHSDGLQYDNEFGPAGYSANSDNTSKEGRDRRTSAEKEMQSHIKSLLGEDHYREYKFAPDWQRSSLRDVAREYNVPKQTALKVFDIRDEARSEASRLRNDQTLSTDQRQAALSVVRAATETALGEVLGANAARAYVEKGSWIKNLCKREGGGPQEPRCEALARRGRRERGVRSPETVGIEWRIRGGAAGGVSDCGDRWD
jgi:hypothetical protein